MGRAGLLSPSTTRGEDANIEVGEQDVGSDKVNRGGAVPEATTTEVAAEDPQPTQQEREEDEMDGAVRPSPSPEDTFELDSERFAEEQARAPWIRAMKAFLKDGALALDPQLRVQTLKIAPPFVVKKEILMRKVYLRARSGTDNTIVIAVIPV
ncbi:hypothetical protein PC120_g23289 [Phytophthora cactorum]|nr:hypothetical protein PC120_g23289 [Phytophthora cactorum]